MAHKIIVYGTEWCPWCKRAKSFFEDNKIDFEYVDVGADQLKAQEMVEKSGQTGVPVIDIDGVIVVGFDELKIKTLLKT
jgi:glutaredoxin-like YruB-family protein